MSSSGQTDWYCWEGEDLVLAIHVQPRAKRDEIIGPHGSRLKIRITAPPVDGEANAHLIRYLAECFGVSRKAVELLAGTSGRDKRLRVRMPLRLPPMIPSKPALPQAVPEGRRSR